MKVIVTNLSKPSPIITYFNVIQIDYAHYQKNSLCDELKIMTILQLKNNMEKTKQSIDLTPDIQITVIS